MADNMCGRGLASFMRIASISAFVMTVTIIVLIMQENMRSFYHERIFRMQSGMITFMAEVVENRDDNTGGHIRRTAGEELLNHAKAELGESEYLNTALEMAAYHHEWWNGNTALCKDYGCGGCF